jgi:hypothetical protein
MAFLNARRAGRGRSGGLFRLQATTGTVHCQTRFIRRSRTDQRRRPALSRPRTELRFVTVTLFVVRNVPRKKAAEKTPSRRRMLCRGSPKESRSRPRSHGDADQADGEPAGGVLDAAHPAGAQETSRVADGIDHRDAAGRGRAGQHGGGGGARPRDPRQAPPRPSLQPCLAQAGPQTFTVEAR